jgi:hypothetical protein
VILEGSFASNNPRAVTLAGVSAFRAAAPDGLAVGVFGWADPDTGYAANERTSAGQILGFVIPVYDGAWPVQRLPGRRAFVRPGFQVTLCSGGDFWAKFDAGAEVGAPVYASIVDGSAISGYAADAELTRWVVATAAAPGELAIISTYL